MRYRMRVAFHGREFHGWQRQPGLRTVQGELEKWLSRLLGDAEPISVTGAGRTDAGVHAADMVAHFDTSAEFVPDVLLLRLTAALPSDLVVRSIRPVDDSFHARYTAVGRTYSYRICTIPCPFGRDRHWLVRDQLGEACLAAVAAVIIGRHDFSGFCRSESRKDDNVCRVTESSWSRRGDLLVYRISADRFLHEMVRLLVGTFVDVARGRFDVGRVAEVLGSRDVRLCGEAAPSHGLTLERVDYPGDPS